MVKFHILVNTFFPESENRTRIASDIIEKFLYECTGLRAGLYKNLLVAIYPYPIDDTVTICRATCIPLKLKRW